MKKNSDDSFICLSCEGIMELNEKLPNGKATTISGNFSYEYRRRKFKCPDCGYSEIIFSTGRKDNIETLDDKRYKNFLKEKKIINKILNNGQTY